MCSAGSRVYWQQPNDRSGKWRTNSWLLTAELVFVMLSLAQNWWSQKLLMLWKREHNLFHFSHFIYQDIEKKEKMRWIQPQHMTCCIMPLLIINTRNFWRSPPYDPMLSEPPLCWFTLLCMCVCMWAPSHLQWKVSKTGAEALCPLMNTYDNQYMLFWAGCQQWTITIHEPYRTARTMFVSCLLMNVMHIQTQA